MAIGSVAINARLRCTQFRKRAAPRRCALSKESSAKPAVSVATTLTFDALHTQLKCDEFVGDARMMAPIRGNAATRGMSCPLDGTHVHVFERADDNFDGIDRLLGVGSVEAGCDVEVTVTARYFVVARSDVNLDRLLKLIGEPIRAPSHAAPTVSYLVQGCEID